MEHSWIIELPILIFLIACSAFFSASETALLSLSKIRLKHMVKEEVENAGIIENLLDNTNRLLGTILVGNNIVNIGASAMATSIMLKLYPSSGVGIATAVMTVIVLIFGEITPKNLAIQNSEKFSVTIAPVIRVLTILFAPIVIVVTFLTNHLIRMLGGNVSDKKPFITVEELRTIVDVSSREGVLETEEKEMIYNIFEFGDMRVSDVMIQRMDIESVPEDAGYDEVLEMFRNTKLSRLPVYRETIDDIVGIIYAKDIFFRMEDKESFRLQDFMRPPFNTFEFIKISDFFKQMQKNNIHMATVLDEYGGVAGIITMEDIVESIFGDINDEYDELEEDITVVKEDEYIVQGSTKIDDLNDMIGIRLESEDFDSIGGFIIGELGRLPKNGEVVHYENIKFVMEEVDRKRIIRMRIFT